MTYIPFSEKPRLGTTGKLTIEHIEIQSGAYFGEGGIVRLDCYYGGST
ncbi:MAG: hypothetical protein KJ558_13025 [Gammaproteobacteria bacterium]|nr:hypothetical protein [Gammaproteobacteria bacterium]MBU1655722.1 hypothetical protein [Gammaproteobacteria bacterium]MBU1961483.1 hypothetical protein [Gammaproteobacteria bacterium]